MYRNKKEFKTSRNKIATRFCTTEQNKTKLKVQPCRASWPSAAPPPQGALEGSGYRRRRPQSRSSAPRAGKRAQRLRPRRRRWRRLWWQAWRRGQPRRALPPSAATAQTGWRLAPPRARPRPRCASQVRGAGHPPKESKKTAKKRENEENSCIRLTIK